MKDDILENVKTKKNEPVMGKVVSDISEKKLRVSLFIFFSLLFFSTAFFVFADDATNGKNIFQDSDRDGLSNEEEKLYGTDPFKKDTDGDGYSDGVEVESGYDPLKKAPGDKIVATTEDVSESKPVVATQKDNLTEKVSVEVASVLRNADQNESVSMDQINEAVEKALAGSSQEIHLPDIDIKEIKIKKAPSKKLSEKARKEKEHEDVLEYLTVLSYLIANNSPKTFHTGDELENLLTMLSGESLSALSVGDMTYLDQLEERGKKMLEEARAIEVPEAMLDVHIKALKMAMYASKIKSELQPNESDPLGQVAALSQAQGFLAVVLELSQEIQDKLLQYDITQVPVDL